MNNIKATATATFNPGPVKATPVHVTAKAILRVYANGVPPITVKAPLVRVVKLNGAVFNPGAVKAPPVRTKAKSKATSVRAKATATANQRSYVTRTRAKAHAIATLPPTAPTGKPRDRKLVYSRATSNPPALQPGTRNYVVRKHAQAHAVLLRPAASHDRKTAKSKATFTSFNPGRASKFAWR